jgi:hypothetical protein
MRCFARNVERISVHAALAVHSCDKGVRKAIYGFGVTWSDNFCASKVTFLSLWYYIEIRILSLWSDTFVAPEWQSKWHRSDILSLRRQWQAKWHFGHLEWQWSDSEVAPKWQPKWHFVKRKWHSINLCIYQRTLQSDTPYLSQVTLRSDTQSDTPWWHSKVTHQSDDRKWQLKVTPYRDYTHEATRIHPKLAF